MILVNGSIGIGTGYSTTVPQFNPFDIVAALKTFINGADYEELVPYYRGFIGNIKKIADKKYSVEGVYEIIDDTKVHITEIPINISLEDYITFINTLTIIDKKLDDPKKKLVDYIVKPFNNRVDIIVEFKSSELQKQIKANNLEKYLKLNSTISTTNMHLYNANKKITKYDSAYEILEEFYNSRYKLYEVRKEHTIKVLENDVNIAKYKRMFIEYILDKKIIIEKQKKDVIIARLVELKFPKLAKKVNCNESEKSYSYLIDMPLWSLTYEKIEQLKKELEDTQKILDDYLTLTIEEIWNSELDEFIVNYKKWLQELKEIQDKEDKLKTDNKKSKSKGKKKVN
jgi:DNA topoisomerase-2